MSELQVSTYIEPRWGARITGSARIHKDADSQYYVNNVRIAETHSAGLFTILTCVDATTHYVLTAFFRLIDRPYMPYAAPASS